MWVILISGRTEEGKSIPVIPGTKTHSSIKVLCFEQVFNYRCPSSANLPSGSTCVDTEKNLFSLGPSWYIVSITMSHLMHVGSIVYSSMLAEALFFQN